MNYRGTINIIGRILLVEALFMLPALGIALAKAEGGAIFGFGLSMIILGVIGLLCIRVRNDRRSFQARDGLITVGLAWIIVSVLGGLPFRLSGAIPGMVDCFFETVSGFTTTGATILTEVEHLPASILYWRSFTNWLGGMGVLVFVLAVSPKRRQKASGGDEIHILRAESPGITVEKLVPRMRQSAMILYGIYLALTLLQVVLLLAGHMSLFEALTASFSTAGTGGFGIKNDSFASYSPYIQWVVTIFMLLFSVNFGVYFLLLLRRFRRAAMDEELRVFGGMVGIAVLVITINILPRFSGVMESLRHAAFQVATVVSTTGFMSVDFGQWPALSQGILVLLMLVGACAGSTGGGFKVARLCVLWKAMRRAIDKALQPNAIRHVHMNGTALDERVVTATLGYTGLCVAIQLLTMLLISVDNFDFTSNVTAVIACFNNIGPGLSTVGPTGNFAHFSDFSKIVLSFDMLLGRLELFPILLLFVPDSYKK